MSDFDFVLPVGFGTWNDCQYYSQDAGDSRRMIGKRAVIEAAFVYVMAVALAAVLIILYLLFLGPSHVISYISTVLMEAGGSILKGFGTI